MTAPAAPPADAATSAPSPPPIARPAALRELLHLHRELDLLAHARWRAHALVPLVHAADAFGLPAPGWRDELGPWIGSHRPAPARPKEAVRRLQDLLWPAVSRAAGRRALAGRLRRRPRGRASADLARTCRDLARAEGRTTLPPGLPRRDAQVARGYLAVGEYLRRGPVAAARVVAGIAYRSERRAAWLRLLHVAADRGHHQDAEALLERLPAGRWRERGRLGLAERLASQGAGAEASTHLARVGDPALLADALVLRAELLLDAGRPTEARDAERAAHRALPWRTPGPRDLVLAEPALPERLALVRLRLAWREPRAAQVRGRPERLARQLGLGPSSLRWLRASLEAQAALRPRLVALRAALGRWTADAVWAEHLGERALRLLAAAPGAPPRTSEDAAFLAGVAAGRGEGRPRPPADLDPGPERAAWDEGVAATPAAASRRRVVRRAARACLRRVLRERWAVEPPEAAVRARTLLSLRDDGALAAVAEALESARRPTPLVSRLLSALIALGPRQALEVVLRRHALVDRLEGGLEETLVELERRDAVEPGFPRSWLRLRDALVAAAGRRAAHAWLDTLAGAWERRTGAPPRREEVDLLRERVGRGPLASPADLLAGGEAEAARLLELPPVRLVERLAANPDELSLLLLLRPPSLPIRARRWSRARWAGALRRIGELGAVDPAVARDWAGRLPGGASVAEALLEGRAPVADLRPTPLERGETPHRLRYLDKRTDLSTWLRFADCVACCYHSADVYWREVEDTQRHVLALWKDPLSFCVHVERRRGDAWRPVGFVFGSFGLVDDAPVALLNGVYLRQQRAALRAATLDALEARLWRPLGLGAVGLAAEHGGRGPAPPEYRRSERAVLRLRALTGSGRRGAPWDDISSTVNRVEHLDHLLWKDLAGGPAGAGAP